MAGEKGAYVHLEGDAKLWYQVELNTANLVRAVVKHRPVPSLTGDDIWNLLRLTWITVHGQDVVPDHWKRLKVPALAELFGCTLHLSDDIESSLSKMRLPKEVKLAAASPSGMVNYRGVWRNSAKAWCSMNRGHIQGILGQAFTLSSNDQKRFDLSRLIESLPGIPSPNGRTQGHPDNLLTPLVAALDPVKKFPIVNGRDGVCRLLHHLQLGSFGLEQQVKGLIGLVGNFGIVDAFVIDNAADQIIKIAAKIPRPAKKPDDTPIDPPDLKVLDEDERRAVVKAQTLVYRRRHNKMTTALPKVLPGLVLKRGYGRDDQFDVLVKDYDGHGRDLLIEAKPDPDRGSLRIAIGQLFDYRRGLSHQAGTDLAFLSISRPPDSYVELLMQLQITVLWFVDETCTQLDGDGKGWLPLAARFSHGA